MKARAKRILLVSPLPPAVGGISVSTSRLRDRLLSDGYEVDTYNLQMNVMPVGHALWQLVNMLWLPFYILGKKKYDIIHLHVSGYWRRVYVRLVKVMFKGADVVVTIHGDVANFINLPLCQTVLAAADRIICVRPGNRSLLPASLRDRTAEIPAFIMPPASVIAGQRLPAAVEDFITNARREGLSLIVFNGSVVLSGPYYDLYGFGDMAEALKRLAGRGIAFASLLVVNDMHIDSQKAGFLSTIEKTIEGCGNVMVCKGMQFSLLPVLAGENTLYVRPTKTDGDSLSVREALALGARVVASDAAPRPVGTVCYDTAGGADPLYKAMYELLTESDGDAVATSATFNDYYDKIIGVYDSLI